MLGGKGFGTDPGKSLVIDVILEVYRSENQLFWNEYHIWILWEKALPIRIEKKPFSFRRPGQKDEIPKVRRATKQILTMDGIKTIKATISVISFG